MSFPVSNVMKQYSYSSNFMPEVINAPRFRKSDENATLLQNDGVVDSRH